MKNEEYSYELFGKPCKVELIKSDLDFRNKIKAAKAAIEEVSKHEEFKPLIDGEEKFYLVKVDGERSFEVCDDGEGGYIAASCCLGRDFQKKCPCTCFVFRKNSVECIPFDPEAREEDRILCAAHNASFKSGAIVKARRQKCVCFCCERVFDSEDVCFITEMDGQETPVCPCCGIDSVLCEDNGYPMTKEFIGKMRRRYFGGDLSFGGVIMEL